MAIGRAQRYHRELERWTDFRPHRTYTRAARRNDEEMAMKRLVTTLVLGACLLLAGTAAAAASVDDSFIKLGTYKGTAKIAPSYVSRAWTGGSFPISFVLTARSRRAHRKVTKLTLGPIPAFCNKPSGTVGVADQLAQFTLPKLTNLPPLMTDGFIVRSYVDKGGQWKPTKAGASTYGGPLPHVDLGFVYNSNPTRFNPNPLTTPSVVATFDANDDGTLAPTGPWTCIARAVVTVKHT